MNAKLPKKFLDLMNKEFAVIVIEGKTRIVRFHQGNKVATRSGFDLMNETDFHTYCANRKVVLNKTEFSQSRLWLESKDRLEYSRGLSFEPGSSPPCGYLNLWSGFAVDPTTASPEPFLAFIKDVICANHAAIYAYVLEFLADMVQNPAKRPGAALVLRGEQGIGKSFFAETIGKLFGRHFIEVSSDKQLVGSFNRHLLDKLLVFADEGSLTTKAASQRLKNLITSDTMTVEPKGLDSFQAKNLLRVIIASNDDAIVRAAADERRYCVIDVSPHRKNDHLYFTTLSAWRSASGLGGLLNHLMNYQLGAVNLRNVPRTAALLDQKIASLDPVAQAWLEFLQAGEVTPGKPWSGFYTSQHLADRFSEELGPWQGRSLNMRIAATLKRYLPEGVTKVRQNDSSGRRAHGFHMPSLSNCRIAFERQIGHPIEWQSQEEK